MVLHRRESGEAAYRAIRGLAVTPLPSQYPSWSDNRVSRLEFMMGPQVDTIASDKTLPVSADVVVIGGGIIGVTSALYLAERGLSVVLVEKGHIAGEQSSRNWGWVRQAKRDPAEFELIRAALELWRGMDAHIGAPTGFKTTGIMYAAGKEADYVKYAKWAKDAADAGIHAQMIEGADVARHLPGDIAPPKAALFCATDGRAEPQRAAPHPGRS